MLKASLQQRFLGWLARGLIQVFAGIESADTVNVSVGQKGAFTGGHF
jgi:hypothetical protein